MCKPYNCAPYAAGVRGATDSTAVTMCGQETKSLSHELEGDNIRQVGVRHGGRISNSLHQSTSLGTLAKPEQSSLLQKEVNTLLEKSAITQVEPSSSREFLFNPVPCSQERRSDETSYQPQKVERVGGTSALKDGRYGDTQGTVEGERLDGEGRSERCLLHHSNACRSSTISKVQGEITTLPVHLPTIWPVVCPMGLHQGDEALSILLRSMGVRMIVYIDDMLLMAESINQVEAHLEALIYLLTGMGFVINIPKSITIPTQQIEFLGM